MSEAAEGRRDPSPAAWWRGAVLYQVYLRSFRDSDGDGVGDLRGLLQGLDHIAGLGGVDALWVSPFYASPQRDFGYDVADHCAVDPAFGRVEDVDRLIAAAHGRGLRVLLDFIPGHTSDRHPWFLESRAARQGPRADWYVWADPAPDGTPPNNWLSVFGGPAWTWEPRRRQYYLHHFLPSQPALNLRHPAVLDALEAIARFWLARGVDGFRLDAVDFLAHDPALRSNPPAPPPPDGAIPAKPFAMQLHHHDMLHPDGRAVLRRLRAVADQHPGTVLLGEVSSQPGAFDRVAAYTAGEDLLHLAYALGPLRGGFDHEAARSLIAAAAACGEAPGGTLCWSFSNHDVPRAASRWAPPGHAGDRRFAKLLLALLLTLRGAACLYQGEELGLPEADLPFEALRDPFGLAYWPEFRGRDGSRTPLPWRASAPQAGFTAPDAMPPWLPISPEHRARAVEVQEADPDSVLAFTRRMLALRRRHPALRLGTLQPLDAPPPLLGFLRAWEDERLLCAFNIGAEPVALPPDWHAALEAASPAVLEPFGTLCAVLREDARLRPCDGRSTDEQCPCHP